MAATWSGRPAPRAHIDLPPDWSVIRLQSGSWADDIDQFCAALPRSEYVTEPVVTEVRRELEAMAYEGRAAGAVVMALTSGVDRRTGFHVASLVVLLTNCEPDEASLEPVREALADLDAADLEEFDTPSGPALMCTELMRVDDQIQPVVGAHQWRARAYLPVPGSSWTVVAQVQASGRWARTRATVQSVAARIVHSFELRAD